MLDCKGIHRYFVAETGTVENSEGAKVCVVIVCTACGESKLIEHILSGRANVGKHNGEFGRPADHKK